jgi:hypothetical protein
MSLIPQPPRGEQGVPGIPGGGLALSGVLALGNTTDGINIDGNSSDLLTNTVRCVALEPIAPLLVDTIAVNGDLGFVANAELKYANGAVIRTGTGGLTVDTIPNSVAPQPNLLTYDSITGEVFYETVPPIPDLDAVLTAGNSAGSNDINMNGNDLIGASTVFAGFINPEPSITTDLTINAPSGSVIVEGLSINGTTISAPATNADINFAMNGNGSITVSNTTAIGGADPLLQLTTVNTTGGTANPVKVQMFKDDSNTVAGDVIGDITVRARGGAIPPSPQAIYDYTSIKSIVRATGNNNVDGSLQFQVAENATSTNPSLLTYIECNGGNVDVDIRKPLDMNGNNITTSSSNMTITTAPSSGFGNITITAKGQAKLSSSPLTAVIIEGETLELNGSLMIAGTAGSATGDFLQITVNGTPYAIPLLSQV